jgi:hypothetical protein
MSGTGIFALYQIAGTKRVNVGSRSQTAPVEAAIRSPYERCPDLALGGGGRDEVGAALFLWGRARHLDEDQWDARLVSSRSLVPMRV